MKRSFFLIVLSVLISGCKAAQSPFTSTPYQIDRSATAPSVQITHTQMLRLSQSHTHPIPTSTLTPQPTLSSNEAKEFFGEMLITNGGCNLPCIWGIQPDKGLDQPGTDFFDRVVMIEDDNFYSKLYTSQDHIIVSLGLRSSKNIRSVINLGLYREGVSPNTTLLNGEIIRESGSGVEAEAGPAFGEFLNNPFLQYYWLPNILQNYGKPAEILLFAPMEDEMDRPSIPMGLVLIYSDQGFIVGYAFPRKVTSTTFLGCPAEAAYFGISSWDKNHDLDLEQMMGKMSGPVLNVVFAKEYKPLEEVTSMTDEEFYSMYQQPDARDCFSTPKDIWLPPKVDNENQK